MRAKNLLEESAAKYKLDYVELENYSAEGIALIFDSVSDVCQRALKEVKENKFDSDLEAIEFSALIVSCLLRTLTTNIQSLALLKQIVKAKKN